MQFLLLLFNLSIRQIAREPIIYDCINETYASEFIFFGTEVGVLKFDRSTKTWSSIVTGLPGSRIKIIALNEGIIWIGTEKGLACADIRLNDWQAYPFESSITGIDFDDDYVWVGTDSGLIRIDKYTERWDTIINKKINALYNDGDILYLGTDSGILQYNRQFERTEVIPEIPDVRIDYIIGTTRKIWFLSEELFLCYDRTGKYWRQYQGFPLRDYQNTGDSLYLLTEDKLIFFNPRSENWHEFIELGGINSINGFAVNSKNLLLAGENGILIYNFKEGSRQNYTTANGLMSDTFIDVYEDNRFVFAIGKDKIQYLDKETEIWQAEGIKAFKAKSKKILYYDNGGLHASFHKDIDLRLQGRIYNTGSLRISDSGSDTTLYNNFNVNLLMQHKSNRLLSMYYDDTDKEQIIYGFGYRGLDKDFLYRVNGGYLRSEFYNFNIVPEFSTLGGDAKIKLKEHILGVQGGLIKSSLKKDFFYGRFREKIDTIMDVDFQKNIFYYIYDGPRKINKGFDTIFIDDRIEENNDIGTRRGMTIAGFMGDFDLFINGVDYMIDYNNGIIHFLRTPNLANAIIVILLNGEEIVIKGDSVVGHQVENIYSLSPKIIPNTLELRIIDTTGQTHSLDEFGIDMDNDHRVDPQFINCDIGYLKFPARRPFPDQVYDDTVHIYSMIIHYATNLPFYSLSFYPVLPGSEEVYVDGELMNRGSDYILDYTSGRLIFIKRGIITDLSEIEVQYMYVQKQGKEDLYSIQPNLKISNDINIAPGMAVLSSESLLFFTGRMETDAGNKGLRFIPQVAINQKKNYAQRYDLILNYGLFSLTTKYSNFDNGFETFGLNKKRFGRLEKEWGLGLRIEPLRYVRVEGSHTSESQIDSLNNKNLLHYNKLGFMYLNPSLPNLYLSMGKDLLLQYDKTRFQIGANYNAELKRSRLKCNSVINNDWFDADLKKDKVFEYYINTNLLLPFPVSINLDLREGNFYNVDKKTKQESELRLTTNVDVVSGVYYTSNYEGNIYTYNLIHTKDLSLNNYFYNGINVAPGRWYSKLSFLNLGFGMGNSFNEYLSNAPENYRLPLLLIKPVSESIVSSINNSNNYFFSVQLTPSNNLFIWLKENIIETGYAYYTTGNLMRAYADEIRVEYDIKNIGLFNTYYLRKRAYTYPQKTDHNLYFLWSKPWSDFFRTKVYTDFQNNLEDYGGIESELYKIKLGSEMLFQFRNRNLFVINIAGTKNAGNLREEVYSIIPGAGVNLNLIEFFYIQFDWQSEISYSYINHNLSAKIIGQF